MLDVQIASLKEREELRQKMKDMLIEFNGGKETVTKWGITVNLRLEFEKMLYRMSAQQVRRCLEIAHKRG